MTTEKPDIKKAMETADEILLGSDQFAFPLDIELILMNIKLFNIQICKYSDSADGDKIADMNSGFVEETNGIYYVVYNDFIENDGHKRFTLLHELGHVVLSHDLNDKDNKRQETEADYFAAELLMPQAIIGELVKRGYDLSNTTILENIFLSSKKASKISIERYRKLPEWHKKYEDTDSILNVQFKSYLDNNFPNKCDKSYDKRFEEEIYY